MKLSFVIYRSQARRKLNEKTVIDILAASVRNNPREGITGFLHTDRDCFLQYLEGPTAPLKRKVLRIQKDRRHKDFLILAEGTIEERFFPNWDMGQIALDTMPAEGLLAKKQWYRKNPDLDPLPLIQAFAAHAGKLETAEISAID